MLSFEAARAKVIETVRGRMAAGIIPSRDNETIEFASDPSRALGRVVAEIVVADREYPPFDRAMRDGFALKSADANREGAELRLIGESRAGMPFSGEVRPGDCVQIMTGAPVPAGADAVVMVEYTKAEGDLVIFEKPATTGQNIVRKGTENHEGDAVLRPGTRLGYAELAMATQVGRTKIEVRPKPRVAILSTGDEIVIAGEAPGPFQIRNSNSVSLMAQAALAGAEPKALGNAADDATAIRAAIEKGLQAELLVLSGGVSAGKYDLVEPVLRELSAEFLFDAVAIRPGRPVVFAICRDKPVFGLPGNPVSTMVTFELFVQPAIEILSGLGALPLPVLRAKLRHGMDLKPPLTHFVGARLSWPEGEPWVEVLPADSSGDIGKIARGNCYMVVHEAKRKLEAGEWVDVLPRRGAF
ncbi:MAG TPA: gephyrin-like molybdotransferase Glp [Verrucomicrobiae bacterium]|nr:gephyrin-like molybdotransferase Glp [Verrucomicrobiae bacterium]